jgi:hypothetical protein
MVTKQWTYFVTDESFQFCSWGTNDESKLASQNNNVIVIKQLEKRKQGSGPTHATTCNCGFGFPPSHGPTSAWSHMCAPLVHGPTCGPHMCMVPHVGPPAHGPTCGPHQHMAPHVGDHKVDQNLPKNIVKPKGSNLGHWHSNQLPQTTTPQVAMWFCFKVIRISLFLGNTSAHSSNGPHQLSPVARRPSSHIVPAAHVGSAH